MKKKRVFALMTAGVMFLCACGDNTSGKDTSSAEAPTQPVTSAAEGDYVVDLTPDTSTGDGFGYGDYTPGAENTFGTARYTNAPDSSGIVVQDNMLYYVSSDRKALYKLPHGADASEAKEIWSDEGGSPLHWDDIQVLGDWLYVQDANSLSRLTTASGVYERLVDDIHHESGRFHQSIVYSDRIYYTAPRPVEQGGGTDIRCFDIGTGTSAALAHVPSTGTLSFTSYTRNNAILGTGSDCHVYDLTFNVLSKAPESLSKVSDGLVSDGDVFYAAVYEQAAGDETIIYRLSPGTYFEPEQVCHIVDGRFSLCGYAQETFFGVSDAGLSYVSEDGVLHTINTDKDILSVCYPGDGYLYYRRATGEACRVKLDGTGWEQL